MKWFKRLFTKKCIKCGVRIPNGNELIHKYDFNIFGRVKPISYMHKVCWCKFHSIPFKDFRAGAYIQEVKKGDRRKDIEDKIK